MRIPALLPTVFIASAAASTLLAQEPRITRIGAGTIVAPGGRTVNIYSEQLRAIIGISTASGSSARDTAGVLVSSVRQGSPAERAGIEEGNRIASINGVSLKLAPADVGDDQMSGVMMRRLSRELDKLKPGDEVDLRVVANGQMKSLKIKTVAPSELVEERASTVRSDDRATLGLNLAVTGSSRDTLGVFVLSVVDDGPAAKAGIEEGSRIASINGVDVRGHRSEDDDDYVFRTSNVSRLEREVARANPGDEIDLRVYFNGQYRNVKVKAARYRDLPRRKSTLTIMGGDNFTIPPLGGMGFGVNSVQVGNEVRRAIEAVGVGMGRTFGRFGGRMDW
jgi:C-terminal processing protease CtpA/Prc